MGKTTRGQKEFSKEQELKYENQQLRNKIRQLENDVRQLTRQTARTRKQFARMDLDRHAYVQEIVQEHYANEEVEQNTQDMLSSLKNKWQCHECGIGHLEITIYTRFDGTFYWRKCSNCAHRTKSQKYDPDKVTGIMRQEDAAPEEKRSFKRK